MTTSTWVLPTIDLQRCTGCGLCEVLCPTSAVEVREGHAVIVRPGDCNYCDVCESYCPEQAIGRLFTIGFANASQQPPGPDHADTERG